MLIAQCNAYVHRVFDSYVECIKDDILWTIPLKHAKKRVQNGTYLKISDSGRILGFCTEVWTKEQIDRIESATVELCESFLSETTET